MDYNTAGWNKQIIKQILYDMLSCSHMKTILHHINHSQNLPDTLYAFKPIQLTLSTEASNTGIQGLNIALGNRPNL